MTLKERNDLYFGIGNFAEKLSDEIIRLESELAVANEKISDLQHELENAKTRIEELEAQ